MSKKWYGSISNRINEDKQFCEKIEVGTKATQYYYSDSHVYEVVEVIDQKHVSIRRMNAIRTDDNGMSECQDYRFESDPKKPILRLVKRGNYWYEKDEYTKEVFMKRAEELAKDFGGVENAYRYVKAMSMLDQDQLARLENGETIKKFTRVKGISFGIAEEYFDYSF